MVVEPDRRARRARRSLTLPVLAVLAVLALAVPAGADSIADPIGSGAVGGSAGIGFEAAVPSNPSVERLYLAYFLRDPDAGGLAYWNDRFRRGLPLRAISGAFSRSAEFQGRYGALSDRDFVDLVYRNVLSRTPDAGGYAYWLGQMAAGMTRGSLMIGFSESDEFRATYARRQALGVASPTGVTADPVPVVLGPDGLPAAPSDHYAFAMRRPDGTPYTWRPCTPVDVVANFTGAPAGAEAALQDVLGQLSAATRITWRFAGTTDERAPSARYLDRPLTDPARYGDGFSPVLVSWAPDWSDGGGSIGFGGFASAWDAGTVPYAVTGAVTLDARWRPTAPAELVALLLHEFGHVANLGHVDQPGEVMYPAGVGHAAYQAGDLAGLARVGGWLVDCPA